MYPPWTGMGLEWCRFIEAQPFSPEVSCEVLECVSARDYFSSVHDQTWLCHRFLLTQYLFRGRLIRAA